MLKKPSQFFNEDDSSSLEESLNNIDVNSTAFKSFKENIEKINSLSDFSETLDNYRKSIDEVNILSKEVGDIRTEIQSLLRSEDLDNALMGQYVLIDQSISDVQEKVKSINDDKLRKIRENVSSLTNSVTEFLDIDVPKYKKLLFDSEVRTDKKYQDLEERVNDTLETSIENIEKDLDERYDNLTSTISGINKDSLDSIIEDFKSLDKEVLNLKENDIPRYKKLVVDTETKSEIKIDQFSKKLDETVSQLEEKISLIDGDKSSLVETLNKKIKEVGRIKKTFTDHQIYNEEFKKTIDKKVNSLEADIVRNESHIKSFDKNVKNLQIEILRNESSVKVQDSNIKQIKESVRVALDKIDFDVIEKRNHQLSNKIKYLEEVFKKFDDREILTENLIAEPSSTSNKDPLTPLDNNFVTLDQLQSHYKLFINRIQQQLATIGGGGETRLEFLDDIDRDSVKVDGKFLQYQASTGKWVGGTGGGGALDTTLTLGNASGIGISVGISTISKLTVGIGTTFSEDLVVNGDARITGILTIGTASITLDSTSKQIKGVDEIHIGTASTDVNPVIIKQVTSGKNIGTIKFAKTHKNDKGEDVEIEGEEVSVGIGTTVSINTTGIITASSFSGDGSNLSGISAVSLKDNSGNLKLQGKAAGTMITGNLIGDGSTTISGISTCISTEFIGDLTGNSDTSTNTSLFNSNTPAYYLNYNNFSNTPTLITNNNQLTNGAGYITTSFTSYNQLSDKPTIPTNNNQLTNGAGYITASGTASLAQGLTGTPNIVVGSVTGSTASFSGNVTIGGTLTYEDVTNIDSVGLITARSGIKADSDIVINLGNLNVNSGNVSISGVSTFQDNITVGSAKKIQWDTVDNFHITTTAGAGLVETSGELYYGTTHLYIQKPGGTTTMAEFIQDGAVKLNHSNSTKLETTANGVTVTGTVSATSFSGSGSSLTGLTGASAATYGSATAIPVIVVDSDGRITGISTVANSGTGGISDIVGDTTPQLGGDLDVNGKNIVDTNGNEILKFSYVSSAVNELRIVNAAALGSPKISATGANSDISISLDPKGSGSVYVNSHKISGLADPTSTTDAATKQYVDNNSGIASVSSDTTPQLGGNLDANSKDISGVNNLNVSGISTFGDELYIGYQKEIYFGNDLSSTAFQISQDGSADTLLKNNRTNGKINFEVGSAGSGHLEIRNRNGGEVSAKFIPGADVELYYDGNKKLETTNDGVVVTGIITATTFSGNCTGNADTVDNVHASSFLRSDTADSKTFGALTFYDNIKSYYGTGQDLEIYHNGSNSVIKDAGVGSLFFIGNQFRFRDANDNFSLADFTENSSVDLYYNGSKKFETTSDGAVVTGILTATSFVKSGGTSSQYLMADGSVSTGGGGGGDVVDDTTPQLGGDLDVNGNNINFGDSASSSDDRLVFGAGSDLMLYHDGSNSYVHDDGAGKLRLCSNTTQIRNASDNNTYALFSNSGFEVYKDGSKIHETIGAGLTVYGDVYATEYYGDGSNLTSVDASTLGGVNHTQFIRSDAADIKNSGLLRFNDNIQVEFGNSSDMTIKHDGTDNHITSAFDKDLNIEVSPDGGTPKIYIRPTTSHQGITLGGGSGNPVELYHNNAKKLETTSTGIDVTGLIEVDNSVVVKSDDGTPGRVDLYCESSNAHYARIQSPDHADFSGNITITLPNSTGTLLNSDGSGANLTALNASNLGSGTVPDARFPSTLPAVSGSSLTGLTGASAATYGNSTATPVITVDANGRITGISTVAISGGGGGGGGASEAFKTIAVSGQSDVVADSATDTLTLVAGSNMTITTNASGDSVTFASSGGGGGGGGVSTGKAIAMAMIFG